MESVRDFYNKVWREYADPQSHPMVARALEFQAAALKKRLLREKPRRVLDLGCGPAPIAKPHWAPLVVYGDIVLPMLLDLKGKLPAPTVCLNATHPPFATGSFQMIWCSLLVDHIGDVRSWVSELMRLLDQGGVLALACWDQSLLPPELYPEGKMLYRTSGGGVLAAPTYRNWKEAKRILLEHDPATEIDSRVIVKDRYVLEIAWTRSRA